MSRSKALWVEEALAPKMEGKLYEHIWVTMIGEQYAACKDYYAVIDGEVYMVNDGKEQASEDSLEDTQLECMLVGEYDPDKIYERKILYYSKEQLKELLKLN